MEVQGWRVRSVGEGWWEVFGGGSPGWHGVPTPFRPVHEPRRMVALPSSALFMGRIRTNRGMGNKYNCDAKTVA